MNDSCAAFETLRAWAHLTELRIARAQAQGEHPHAEPLQIRQEVIEDLQVQRALLHGLMRELRIIAELPGGWTVPASGKRKQSHLSQQMAQEIIGTLNPLVQQLGIQEKPIPSLDVTCAPDDYDVSPYTQILRWYLDEGEELRALAFPVNALTHKVVAPTIDRVRSKPSVDSAWSKLPTPKDATEWSLGWVRRATGRAVMVSPEMVAVTGRRIITADPQEFIQKGIVKEEFSINDVTPTFTDTDDALPELDLTQGEKKCREWCFPSTARVEARSVAEMLVDDPMQLLPPTKPELTDTQDDIEAADPGDSEPTQSPDPAQNTKSAPNDASAHPETVETPAKPTA